MVFLDRRSLVTVRHRIGGNAEPVGLSLVSPETVVIVAPGAGTSSYVSVALGSLPRGPLVFWLNGDPAYPDEDFAEVSTISGGFLLSWEHPPSGDAQVDFDDAFSQVLVTPQTGFLVGAVAG